MTVGRAPQLRRARALPTEAHYSDSSSGQPSIRVLQYLSRLVGMFPGWTCSALAWPVPVQSVGVSAPGVSVRGRSGESIVSGPGLGAGVVHGFAPRFALGARRGRRWVPRTGSGPSAASGSSRTSARVVRAFVPMRTLSAKFQNVFRTTLDLDVGMLLVDPLVDILWVPTEVIATSFPSCLHVSVCVPPSVGFQRALERSPTPAVNRP